MCGIVAVYLQLPTSLHVALVFVKAGTMGSKHYTVLHCTVLLFRVALDKFHVLWISCTVTPLTRYNTSRELRLVISTAVSVASKLCCWSRSNNLLATILWASYLVRVDDSSGEIEG